MKKYEREQLDKINKVQKHLEEAEQIHKHYPSYHSKNWVQRLKKRLQELENELIKKKRTYTLQTILNVEHLNK